MKEEKFYGLDASDIEMLIRARDYLDSVKDTIVSKMVKIEQLSDEEYKPHRNEYRGLENANAHLDYALDYIEQAFSDLRHY